YADGEDAKFREFASDLTNDPERWGAFQNAVVDYAVSHVGIDEGVLADLWNGASKLTGPQVVRSREFQQILHDAVQYRLGLARARETRPKITPKPLAPGSTQPANGAPAPPATA